MLLKQQLYHGQGFSATLCYYVLRKILFKQFEFCSNIKFTCRRVKKFILLIVRWFVSFVLWHIDPCRLFNSKSCLYSLNIYDLLTLSLYVTVNKDFYEHNWKQTHLTRGTFALLVFVPSPVAKAAAGASSGNTILATETVTSPLVSGWYFHTLYDKIWKFNIFKRARAYKMVSSINM